MSHTLLAAFPNAEDADAAVQALETEGFDSKKISVIAKEDRKVAGHDTAHSMAEGAVSGATTGGAIGGIAGLLAGAGVFPALAGMLIGGPIAAALGATGAVATTVSGAVTGAVAGGLIGSLVGLGATEDDARYYDERVRGGGIVVGVAADDTEAARAILDENGAERITVLRGAEEV